MITVYKIISNKKISENSYEMIINAPLVIEKCIPGQFVIVMGKEDSERIIRIGENYPLSIKL